MATQYAFGKIVTDGLVLALDAADRNSYVSGSNTWFDLSGNNYSGSLFNGPTFSSGSGGTIVFDGVNDFVSGSTAQLSGSSLSIGCWIKPIVVPVTKTYFGLGNVGGNNLSIHLRFFSDTSMRFGLYSDDLDVTINSVTGKWNYFVATLDSNRLQSIYQNSSFIGSKTANSLFIGNNLYSIGAWATPTITQNINAEIASVQIYNRALSAQEIQQNYNAQKSRFNL